MEKTTAEGQGAKCFPQSVTVLKKRVAELEAENVALRQQIAALNGRLAHSQPSYEESRREQQRNFFKYSNARRY